MLVHFEGLTFILDWVPMTLNGIQRGEVYLEMTFYVNVSHTPPFVGSWLMVFPLSALRLKG